MLLLLYLVHRDELEDYQRQVSELQAKLRRVFEDECLTLTKFLLTQPFFWLSDDLDFQNQRTAYVFHFHHLNLAQER